jgi:hypothetical protein
MYDSTSLDTALTTRDMQLELHLQETCDWNRTYKRDAIGIAPTRDMQLESNLQERCDWNRTYTALTQSHPIGRLKTPFSHGNNVLAHNLVMT